MVVRALRTPEPLVPSDIPQVQILEVIVFLVGYYLPCCKSMCFFLVLTNRVLVGAPGATYSNAAWRAAGVKKTGVLFWCGWNETGSCKELPVDIEGSLTCAAYWLLALSENWRFGYASWSSYFFHESVDPSPVFQISQTFLFIWSFLFPWYCLITLFLPSFPLPFLPPSLPSSLPLSLPASLSLEKWFISSHYTERKIQTQKEDETNRQEFEDWTAEWGEKETKY